MIRVYEAIVAISIISVALVFLFKEYESYSSKIEISKIFETLRNLDAKNELRKYALANDSKSIEEKLSVFFPELNFIVEICSENCQKPNITQEFFSLTYLIAGDVNSFSPREIVVYVIE